jgi:hypothetical protein
MVTGFWGIIAAVVAVTITAVIVGFAVAVLFALFRGGDNGISLKFLLSESGDDQAKASLSRFQFLIFTFVIGGIYLVLCLESGSFVDIPQNAVILLGVSGGTYAASKGIQAADDSSKNKNGGGSPTPNANPNPTGNG